MPGADTPMNTSALTMTSASLPWRWRAIRHVGHFSSLIQLSPSRPHRSRLTVAERRIREASREQQLRDRRRRRACVVHDDDAHVLFLLSYHLQCVRKGPAMDDRVPCWSSWKMGMSHFSLSLRSISSSAGRGDILEIDAAERAGDVVHRLHELVHVLRLHAQRERVHIAERLEEHTLVSMIGIHWPGPMSPRPSTALLFRP